MLSAEPYTNLEARIIDFGFAGLLPPAPAIGLKWESIARHRKVIDTWR